MRKRVWLISLSVVFLAWMWFMSWILKDSGGLKAFTLVSKNIPSSSKRSSSSSKVSYSTRRTINEGYYGAIYKSDLNKFMDYLSSQDYAMTNGMIASKRVFELKAGTKVSIVKSDWSGLVQIRKIGTDFKVWTFREAVME